MSIVDLSRTTGSRKASEYHAQKKRELFLRYRKNEDNIQVKNHYKNTVIY